MRAIVTASSRYHDPFYRSLTNQARLAFASINPVLQLKKTLFAVGIDIV
jgi:hypothetical protein